MSDRPRPWSCSEPAGLGRTTGRLAALLFDHLAPFGRRVTLGNATGEDRPLSSDASR